MTADKFNLAAIQPFISLFGIFFGTELSLDCEAEFSEIVNYIGDLQNSHHREIYVFGEYLSLDEKFPVWDYSHYQIIVKTKVRRKCIIYFEAFL